MDTNKITDAEGHTFDVNDGVLTCRERDGSLGFSIPVENIKEIRVGTGDKNTAIAIGIPDPETGQFDADQGNCWVSYGFDSPEEAKRLARRIGAERKEA